MGKGWQCHHSDPLATCRLLKYECANQVDNDGSRVTTSAGVVNSSLTGVSYAGSADYRYPSVANTWEQMVYDFELDAPTDVTLSLGYSVSASAGAANNTLLYIDNVRLLRKTMSGIRVVADGGVRSDGAIYNIAGQRIASPQRGLYIQNGKVRVK